jgi:hypothetical protein
MQTAVRWLLIPMLIAGFVLVVVYAVQVVKARRRAAVDQGVEGRFAALEKDD